jgi:phosphatidylserine/phosphatidylglycerophosphate/cardiolipin synthase-like enzyme
MNTRELTFLADLIEAQRLSWPPDGVQLQSSGIAGGYDECQRLLVGAVAAGSTPEAAAWMLRQIANERARRDALEAAVQPVISGPCLVSGMRRTEDAFRDIIDHATNSILITGFALHNGPIVLAHLARRMDAQPALDVVLCLDVSRAPGDSSDNQAIIAAFASRFRHVEWPGTRAPRLFYDPRSLARGADDRSALHAKIAVADSSRALVGSANLTDAALKRNIEIGVLISLPAFVARIRGHVEALIHNGILVPAPL